MVGFVRIKVGGFHSTKAFPSGIIFNTYKVVGALKAG